MTSSTDMPSDEFMDRVAEAMHAKLNAPLCQRCENGSRHGTLATRRIEWRETTDDAHWRNRVTFRCDACAEALIDWLGLDPRFARPVRGSIERDDYTAHGLAVRGS